MNCLEIKNIWETLLTEVTAAGFIIFAFPATFTILTFAHAFGKPHEPSKVKCNPVKYPGYKISIIRLLAYLCPFTYQYL